MNTDLNIQDTLSEIAKRSPAGFAIAFHIKFTTPDFLFQSYSKDWINHYSERGLVMLDPVVRWGFSETGKVRWGDIAHLDGGNVMEEAEKYGLKYGAAFSLSTGDSRSFAGFSRSDREFTDEEIDELSELVTQLHHATESNGSLTPEAREELKRQSSRMTHPSNS